MLMKDKFQQRENLEICIMENIKTINKLNK